jgi:hypothetical protein
VTTTENNEKMTTTENNEKMTTTESNEKMTTTENNEKMTTTENNDKENNQQPAGSQVCHQLKILKLIIDIRKPYLLCSCMTYQHQRCIMFIISIIIL